MEYISVCKNVIASNNKKNWQDPQPAIRVSKTAKGNAFKRAHRLAILDKNGNICAEIISSTDGLPVLKCGAKVAIIAERTEIIQ